MKKLGLVTLLVLLAGCATPLLPDCQRFGRDGQVCLLPPADLPKLDAVHMVTVTRDGQPDSFMGQLHIDDQTLRLAGSSLFGTGLFTLSYDGHAIQAQPDDPELHADTLVVMLELALADPAALKPRLHGLDLTVSETATGEVRDISEHGHAIVHIERGKGPLPEAPLELDIPPLNISVSMKPLETGKP
ncbi:MAG TPA: DUF3261 domain-containing protein [Gammaproteobacteria bacterium]|jgi:hypothetical protein